MTAPSKCVRCGARSVVKRTGAGRTTPYRTIPALELPTEFAVPSCGRCNELYLAQMDQTALAATLRETFQQSLRKRVRVALQALKRSISWRKLEIQLGLSQGYLSRLRAGAGNPSPELVGLLALLAEDPSLLTMLATFWATPDSDWKPSERVPTPPPRPARRPDLHLPDRKLAEIRDRTDIVSVIGQYVKLLRSGADYFGACPFHDDKDASFHVSVSKQFYYCFGCQRSGDAIRFLCDKENRTEADVVADLARRAGLDE